MARQQSTARAYRPDSGEATDLLDVPPEYQVQTRIVLTEESAAEVLAMVTSDSEIPPPPPALQALIRARSGR